MIKLKDILLENSSPSIFTARRTDDRTTRYAANNLRKAVKLVDDYIAGGSKGDLNLSGLDLIKLPSNLKNINVDGNFNCGDNKLTSLEGAPTSVHRGFSCSDNELISLEGAPTTVGRSFHCSNNKLISLSGAPKSVGGRFTCNINLLTSLEGAPKSIGKDFYCTGNILTSLEGAPRSVGRDFYCHGNTKKFTKDEVRAVCDVKGMILV